MDIVALIIALVALIVSLRVFFAPRPAGGIVRYTITGNVDLNNDCDGLLASLPAQVMVKTSLNDNLGQSSGGTALVALVPDPAGNPRKTGAYSITVVWGPGFGNPTNWDTPVATLPNGQDICQSITCAAAGSRCLDMVARTRTVPFVNPNTTYDIRLQCSCVGP